ncbi:hypothetical protein ABZV64_19410 [Streptomyces sp. NPDC004959]|uniref:hypothetical protein n=1 Tax=unclassified Streptomyces TaxID=2593676 RepID=UPI0004C87FB0|nr:hypothetical protein [Streptomyces sp. NRRL F-5630]
MDASRGGTSAMPSGTACARELAHGAAWLRVSLSRPGTTWPHPYCRAYDEEMNPVRLNRAAARTLARWVIRSYPDTDWSQSYDLDLASGALTPSAERGR